MDPRERRQEEEEIEESFEDMGPDDDEIVGPDDDDTTGRPVQLRP